MHAVCARGACHGCVTSGHALWRPQNLLGPGRLIPAALCTLQDARPWHFLVDARKSIRQRQRCRTTPVRVTWSPGAGPAASWVHCYDVPAWLQWEENARGGGDCPIELWRSHPLSGGGQRRGYGGAAQALGKPPGGGEANIMAVAPPAARFPYLPISMPAGAGARGLRAHAADAKLALGARGARRCA